MNKLQCSTGSTGLELHIIVCIVYTELYIKVGTNVVWNSSRNFRRAKRKWDTGSREPIQLCILYVGWGFFFFCPNFVSGSFSFDGD